VARYISAQPGASEEWFKQKARQLAAASSNERYFGDMLASTALSPLSVFFPVSTSTSSIQSVFNEAAKLVGNDSPQLMEISMELRGRGEPQLTLARQAEMKRVQGFEVPAPDVQARIWQKANKLPMIGWMGSRYDETKRLIFDATREATDKEWAEAKKSVNAYEEIDATTRKLDAVKASGLPFTEEQDLVLQRNKDYLAALYDPMNKLRAKFGLEPLAPPPASHEAFGVAFLPAAVVAAGATIGLTEGGIIIVGGLIAAVIVVALLLAWSEQRAFETKKLLKDQIDQLTACMSNSANPSEMRRKCRAALETLIGAQDYMGLAWAAVAIVALGVGAYTLGPAIRTFGTEFGTTGASELARWRQSRAALTIPSPAGG
jgi:hypothetical protein